MIICSRKLTLGEAQKLVIAPLSDIHHNARAHDRGKFLEIIEWIRATAERADRQVLVPLMGDYLDTFSGSERRALAAAALHASSREWFEERLLQDTEKLCADLAPIRSSLLCVIDGNHTYKWQEAHMGALVGKTVGRVLSERFDIPYMGVCGALALEVHRSPTSMFPFKMLMHHGFGNASTKSASINQMVKLKERFPAMDLYIMGHNHTPIATVQQCIDMRKNHRTGVWEMVERPQAFVRAASFLKGYIEGEAVDGYGGSYVEEKCYVPAGLGVVTANVRWRKSSRTGQVNGFVVHVQE